MPDIGTCQEVPVTKLIKVVEFGGSRSFYIAVNAMVHWSSRTNNSHDRHVQN